MFHHLTELEKEQMAKLTKNAVFAKSWHWKGAAFQDIGVLQGPEKHKHEARAASVLGGMAAAQVYEEMSPQFLLECHQHQPSCANTGEDLKTETPLVPHFPILCQQ